LIVDSWQALLALSSSLCARYLVGSWQLAVGNKEEVGNEKMVVCKDFASEE